MTGSPDREIMTIEEAAQLLGVSVKTFNKVLHSQNIPARKIGREWKFSRQALIDWIGTGRSTDFYREAPESRNGATPAGATTRETNEQPTERRTTGWRLELD